MSAAKAICKRTILAIAMLAAAAPAELHAQQNPVAAVEIDADDIGGLVTSRFGPEAGV